MEPITTFELAWLTDLVGLSGRARQFRATWLGGVVVLIGILLALSITLTSTVPMRLMMVLTALAAATFFVRAYSRNRALAALAEVDPTHLDGQARHAAYVVPSVLVGIGAPLVFGLVITLFGHPGPELMHAAPLVSSFVLAVALGIAIGTVVGVAQHDRPRAGATPPADGPREVFLTPRGTFYSTSLVTDSPPPRPNP